jgi:UDP-N-acetylglucosamine 1-carboxyvinyltransferase
MGVETARSGRTVRVRSGDSPHCEAHYDIVRKMRASYYVLGPLVGRFGRARVSLPGGCAIGARPVDLHLKGIEALGARVSIDHGYIDARARQVRGATVTLEGPNGPSVGATANTMMAACLAKGETVIRGAACEPDVVDLAGFLNRMGGSVEGAGTPTVRVRGVSRLRGCRHRPIPDRIEVGTIAAAAAITRGEVEIRNCRPGHLGSVLETLEQAGIKVRARGRSMVVSGQARPNAANVSTAPYPGFPTDLQAQFTALLSLGRGTSVVTESIFESRFMHAMELNRMGANIEVNGNVAVVHGVPRLRPAQVMASDLRASAALVLAGLAARGKTEVLRIYHLDRGYERLEEKLGRLGARIERVSE